MSKKDLCMLYMHWKTREHNQYYTTSPYKFWLFCSFITPSHDPVSHRNRWFSFISQTNQVWLALINFACPLENLDTIFTSASLFCVLLLKDFSMAEIRPLNFRLLLQSPFAIPWNSPDHFNRPNYSKMLICPNPDASHYHVTSGSNSLGSVRAE